jgi:hypothetical protein
MAFRGSPKFCIFVLTYTTSSVPDPDPWDPHVFGPPGSWSGSSLDHFIYKQRKILLSTGF